ncbi:lipopolysaccharide biosynthesis protein [Acidipropionibacterium acidipropionici]|uniref:Lipopolysaccharide biosynthesis protein n=1 Tax=Acidipropionibacterium acidipropionici TaxID=1748 RepID=A0AAC8YGQ5_9ACTN|nr:lipopolysaccharide biosynthesis protein [Acidipropionibacterium acidipropionici]AMS06105.1 hypothetical protein AXH35_12335 [Acidipropionibacterium acidipropionici]AOZ47568.1 hypothetical protein A8L58_13785 [Acidipropionibacterium acidipropionici]AZP39109.1 lipopolysaccharide biosynthesis protein [Acidipropionibacterium acidipropionici]
MTGSTDQAEGSEQVDKKALKHASVVGALFNALASLSQAAVGLITLVVFSRLISPSSYGVYAIAAVVLAFGELARDFGLGTASLVEKRLSEGQRSNLFWVNLGTGLVVALIVIGSAPFMAGSMHMPALTSVLPVCGLVFILNGCASQFEVSLKRRYRYAYIAKVNLAGLLISFVSALLLALAGAQYWALVIQTLLGNAISAVGIIAAAGWRPQRYRRDAPVRHLLTQGLHFLGNAAIALVTSNLGTLIIGHGLGAAQVGVYNRANQLVRVPVNQLMNPISSVVGPSLSRLQDDERGFAGYLQKAQALIAYPAGLVAATVAGLAPWAVPLVLGGRWTGAASVVTILSISAIAQAANQAPTWVLWSHGYAKQLARLSLLNAVITLSCVAFGATRGMTGVAWGYAVASILTWPIAALGARRVSGFNIWPGTVIALRMVAVTALCGAASGLVGAAVPGPDVWHVLAGGLASVALFTVLAWVVRPVRRDVQVAIDIIRRR